MLTRYRVEEIVRSIEKTVERMEKLPQDPGRAKRLEYAKRMLAAGEYLIEVMLPSGRMQCMTLPPDVREFLRIYES